MPFSTIGTVFIVATKPNFNTLVDIGLVVNYSLLSQLSWCLRVLTLYHVDYSLATLFIAHLYFSYSHLI